MKLWKRAVFFQRIVRGFLGRRRRHRQFLKIIGGERARINDEIRLVTRAVRKASKDVSWCGLSDTDRFTQQMMWLDGISTRILKGEITVNGKSTIDLPPDQRLSLAVLFAFSNCPNLCIDWNGWSIAKDFFKPKDPKKAPLHQTLWDNMSKVPMHNIVDLSLSDVITPKRTLKWKTSLQKHLPDKLLAKAVLTRRWTFQLNRAIARTVIKFRKSRPPRRVCPQCLEPMFSDYDVYKHNRDSSNICFRYY